MKKISSLLLLLFTVATCFAATKITGTVTVDGKPRKGIVVSDGINVTTTNAKGKYTIKSDSCRNVFVSIPSDCEIPLQGTRPAFYRLIDCSQKKVNADFALKSCQVANEWTLIALADVQIGFDKDLEDLRNDVMPVFVDSIGSYTGTVYGISLGDIVWNNPDFYKHYSKQMDLLGFPVFSVIGNHDHNEITKGNTSSTYEFVDNLGPVNYSLNIGECHLVVLDNILYRGYTARGDYSCGLTTEILEWLKQDLAHVSKDKTLIIGMHAPTERRYANILETGEDMVNANALYEIVKDYRKVEILTGHMHFNSTAIIADNIVDYNLGAVNGAHWYPICSDGSPQGYGVFHFSNGSLKDAYYKGFREPRSYQIRMYAPAEAVLWQLDAKPGDPYDKIAINIFSWDERWKVEVCEDGKWTTLNHEVDRAPLPARDPGVVPHIATKNGRFKSNHKGGRPTPQNDHIFLYRPADNWKEISVRATDSFGNVYTEKLTNK